VWTWGANDLGQIGDGTKVDRPQPVRIDLTDVDQVKAGFAHTIARKRDGTVWQWGSHRREVFGGPTPCPNPAGATGSHFFCDLSPTRVAGLPAVRSIGSGHDHDLAVEDTDDSTVCRWGKNTVAQLGDPTIGPGVQLVCHIVPDHVLAVLGGGGHSLALQSGPPQLTVWTWGQNDQQQLGSVSGRTCDGLACRNAPDQVDGLTDVIGIAAGEVHSLALKTDETVWAWGSDDFAQLGVPGMNTDTRTPVQVKVGNGGRASPIVPLDHVQDIAAGGAHSLALKHDRTVWAWGRNYEGQIGTDKPNLIDLQSSALKVVGLTDVVEVAAGRNFSLARTSDGSVWAWGDNSRGQLGVASTDKCGLNEIPCSFSPIRIPGLTGVKHIAAGGDHAVALANT
jgi:alpha-tubulin suppressor-like RCC1 family protein